MLSTESKPYVITKKTKSKLRENVEIILSAIVIALIIRTFLIEPYKIPTESMVPTLIIEDQLFVEKFTYGIRIPILNYYIPGFRKPKHGDIIVFQYPFYKSPGKWIEFCNWITISLFGLDYTMQNPKYFIKRVQGMPGDTLTIIRKELSINGEPLELQSYPELFDKMPPRARVARDKYYLETSLSGKEYTIQFIHNNYSNRENIYIPRKGDIFLLKKKTEEELAETKFENDESEEGNEYFRYMMENDDSFYTELRKYKAQIVSGEKTIDVSFLNLMYYVGVLPDSELKKLGLERNKLLSYAKNERGAFNLQNIIKYDNKRFSDFKIQPIEYEFKKDFYFMIGDNRNNSSDSRMWGFLPEDYIMGSALITYFPFDRIRTLQ